MTAELINILDGGILRRALAVSAPQWAPARVLQLSATRHGFTVADLEPEPELAPPVFEDFGLAHACRGLSASSSHTYSASHSDGETPVSQAS